MALHLCPASALRCVGSVAAHVETFEQIHECHTGHYVTLYHASLHPQGPADQAVEEVHAILRAIVNMVLNSEECVALQRYIVLKREIMTTAAAALDGMRDDARKMVAGMVEMERSYLTAEVFREILASSHAVDELSEEVHVRTLPSGSTDPWHLPAAAPPHTAFDSVRDVQALVCLVHYRWLKLAALCKLSS